jgi:hypothetical protein
MPGSMVKKEMTSQKAIAYGQLLEVEKAIAERVGAWERKREKSEQRVIERSARERVFKEEIADLERQVAGRVSKESGEKKPKSTPSPDCGSGKEDDDRTVASPDS